MAETIGELLVKIGADVSDLRRGTGEARGTLRQLAADASAPVSGFARLTGSITAVQAGLATLGVVAAAGTLASLTGEAIATAGVLSDQASRIGLNVEALQELQFAAGQAGVSEEALARSLEIFVRNAGQARAGTGQMVSALRDVNPELLNTIRNAGSTEEALDAAFAAIGNAADAFERAQLATALFGRAGQELLPMLDRGADGLEEMRRRARELGIVLSDELVAGGDAAGDALDTLAATVRGNLRQALLEAAPFIEDASTTLSDFAAGAFRAFRTFSGAVREAAQAGGTQIRIQAEFGTVDQARERLAELSGEIETMRGLNLAGLLDDSGREELNRLKVEAQRISDLLGDELPAGAAEASGALAQVFSEERQAEAAEYGDTVAATLAQVREAKNESGAIKLELQGPSPEEWRQALPADVVADFDQKIQDLQLEALANRMGGIEGASAAATQRIVADLTAQGASIEQATQAAEQYVAALKDTESSRLFGEARDEIEAMRAEAAQITFVGPTAELDAFNARIDFAVKNLGLTREEGDSLKETFSGVFSEQQAALAERTFNQLGEDLRVANSNAELLGNTLEGDLKRAQGEAASYGRAIQTLIARGYEVSSDEVQELVSKQREAEASAQSYAAAIAAGADEARQTAEELARVNEGLNNLRRGRTGRRTEVGVDVDQIEEQVNQALGVKRSESQDLSDFAAELRQLAADLSGGRFGSRGNPFQTELNDQSRQLFAFAEQISRAAADAALAEREAVVADAGARGTAGVSTFGGRLTVELSTGDRAVLEEVASNTRVGADASARAAAEIAGDGFAARTASRIERNVRDRTGNRNFVIGG